MGIQPVHRILPDEKSTPITCYRNNFVFDNVIADIVIPESLIVAVVS
jgi:hypothetical protein